MIVMRRVVNFVVCTEVDVRMRMHCAVVRMCVRMDDQALITRRAAANPDRSFANYAGSRIHAEQNQHERYGEFHRESEPRRNGYFENYDRGADYQHGQRVPESPYDADARGDSEPAFAAEDCGHGDYVIGIGGVAHSQNQPQERDCERRGVGRNHQVGSLATRPKTKTTVHLIFLQEKGVRETIALDSEKRFGKRSVRWATTSNLSGSRQPTRNSTT